MRVAFQQSKVIMYCLIITLSIGKAGRQHVLNHLISCHSIRDNHRPITIINKDNKASKASPLVI